MITVQLIGGMGNQMFQYAFARAVSVKRNEAFSLDATRFDFHGGITPRKYALNRFNIQENFVKKEDLKRMGIKVDSMLQCQLQLINRKLFGNRNKYLFIEKSFKFSADVFEVLGDVYFEGFWQTEKYFKDIEAIIRKDFSLKEEFSVENLVIAKEMREVNSVSLHIRRGDYISSNTTNKFHGVCSLEYYAMAIEYIAKKIEKPIFYIFSDDVDWVKVNLESNFPLVYVSDGELRDFEELSLMSYCKHNIIANSSFSWWGAWLNANPEKIIIAPKKWFANSTKDASDIIPEEWVKL